MFDAKALLDQLARGAGPSTSQQGASGLGEVFGRIQRDVGQISAGGTGGIAGMVRDVLGQSVEGVKAGARDLDAATGASAAVTRSTGQSPGDLATKARDLVANNQLAAGAVLGGLGALLLGTKKGRSMVEDVAKVGAIALIGGLAYKAYQNHQAGKPLLDRSGGGSGPQPAQSGAVAQQGTVTNETALGMISAMIAAAAADGRIDDEERRRILDAIEKSQINDEARFFLAREIEHPSTAAKIASGVRSEEEAAQIYTAARLAIDPDSEAETSFLAELGKHLRIDPALANEIDKAARGAA